MPYQSVLGLVVFIGIAWILSDNRKAVNFRWTAAGLLLQFIIAALFLGVPLFAGLFLQLNRAVMALDEATRAGTSFVFGYVGGGNAPFAVTEPANSFVFAFQALPLVLVIGSEGSGMRPLVASLCDEVVSIPQSAAGVESLNASCAASVLLYEIARQVRPQP